LAYQFGRVPKYTTATGHMAFPVFRPPPPPLHMAYVEKHTWGTFKCHPIELHSTARILFFSNFAGILIERQIFSQIDWREDE
jgi:hypothetical protein